jgi:hypothetical protein
LEERKEMKGKLITLLVAGLMFATVMSVSADENEVVSGPVLTQERYRDFRPTTSGVDDIETSPIQTIESVGNRKTTALGEDIEEDRDLRYQVSTDPEAPYIPIISGPTEGKFGVIYEYSVRTVDPECDDLFFEVRFSDMPAILFTDILESGEKESVSHAWSNFYQKEGPYVIYVKAIDCNGHESDWAEYQVNIAGSKERTDYVSWLQIIFNIIIKQFPLLEEILS